MRFLMLFVARFLGRLRFPVLFALAAGLFLVNLVLPDPLPLIDEILLLIGSVALGSFKRRRQDDPDSTAGTPKT